MRCDVYEHLSFKNSKKIIRQHFVINIGKMKEQSNKNALKLGGGKSGRCCQIARTPSMHVFDPCM